MRRTIIALAAAALLLTGCSGDDEPSKKAERSESSATDPQVLGEGSDIPNQVEARGDVEVTACRRQGKRVEVAYRVRNSTEEPARYRLALRVASAKNGSVWGRGSIQTPSVDPSKSRRLSETVPLTFEGTPKKQRKGKVNCIFVAVARDQA